MADRRVQLLLLLGNFNALYIIYDGDFSCPFGIRQGVKSRINFNGIKASVFNKSIGFFEL